MKKRIGLKHPNLIKTIVFAVLLILLLSGIGFMAQPAWKEWNNYDTMHGFYEEPENTIEAAFIGASVIATGITPMELYENYGICAYGIGTERQPVAASYYWAKEVYSRHSETLKTIFFDPSIMQLIANRAFYQKALDGMRLSKNKFDAVSDYTDDLNETISYLFPTFAYHGRWSSLEKSDFDKFTYETDKFTRGFDFTTERYFDTDDYDDLDVQQYVVDERAYNKTFDNDNLYYLKKLMDFCKEKGIRLVLFKSPGYTAWSDAAHNAIQDIADDYGLEFYDFNYEPYIDEINYNHALDSLDGRHMNYYGASKLTDWFGKFLTEECGAKDVRGDEKYAFMEDELTDYKKYISSVVDMKNTTNVTDYLTKALSDPDNTVMMSVKTDAADALTDDQRSFFNTIGLLQLSEIQHGDSYAAVIKNGKVPTEAIDHLAEHPEVDDYAHSKEESISLNYIEGRTLNKDKEDASDASKAVSIKEVLDDGTDFELYSGGKDLGDFSSCLINGEEYSTNEDGINLIVYNSKLKKVTDVSAFNTSKRSEQESYDLQFELDKALESGLTYEELSDDLQKLYMYNHRSAAVREVNTINAETDDDDFLEYLEFFMKRKNTMIYLSVKDDAMKSVDSAARTELEKTGLNTFSELEEGDSYIAIIDDGKVDFEEKDHGDSPLTKTEVGYTLVSGGSESGNVSSIMINGEEYSKDSRGVNVVIYDKELGIVIDKNNFDTWKYPMTVPSGNEETKK